MEKENNQIGCIPIVLIGVASLFLIAWLGDLLTEIRIFLHSIPWYIEVVSSIIFIGIVGLFIRKNK